MSRFAVVILSGALVAAGCDNTKPTPGPAGTTKPSDGDPKIQANLGKLPAEDRAMAEAQKLCPVTEQSLGSMGVPLKVMVKDQPAFLCCKACEKEALDNPDKTLQKVAEL